MGDSQEQGAHQPEIQTDEQDKWQPKAEDKIREEIVSELELDTEADAEKIDKLVQKEVSHQAELSTAIRQKQNWREKANTKTEPVTEPKKPEPITDTDLDSKLDEREISRMDVSDEVKKQMREFKKLNPTLSPNEILNSRYIQSFVQEEKDKQDADDAAISTTPTGRTKVDYSNISISELQDKYDLTTKEGRDGFEKAKFLWGKANGVIN